MVCSSEQGLITSQLLANLGLQTSTLSTLVRHLSEKQGQQATTRDLGQPMDTREWPADQLAWAAAMQAQSCAYLAVELTRFAERLSQSLITCPESTYKRLLDSVETFTRLLDGMVKNYRECNDNVHEGLVPVLSIPMVEEIRYMLAADQATTLAESMTRNGRVNRRSIEDAGDMN